MIEFEQWFINQDFYTNMRFIHGDALFLKDGDVYRVLPVQMAYEAWNHQQTKIDELTEEFEGDKKFLNEQIQPKDTQIENLQYIQKSDKELIASQKKRIDRLHTQNKEIHDREIKQFEENVLINAKLNELQKRIDGVLSVCNENRLNIGKFMIEDETLELIVEVEKAVRGEHE